MHSRTWHSHGCAATLALSNRAMDVDKLLRDPRVQVARWASLQRVAVVFCLTTATYLLPLFDASPSAVPELSTSQSLRWDAFYFASIARNNYIYEQHWAFLPGAPFIARILVRFVKVDLVFAVSVAAFLASPILHLYDLTFEITGSSNVSRLVSALSLLPSSPATLIYSPYAEPFFTTISYTGVWHAEILAFNLTKRLSGMLACAQKRHEAAALAFTLATLFRSNGIVLGGFILWDLLVEPVLLTRKLSSVSPCVVLCCRRLDLRPAVRSPLFLRRRSRPDPDHTICAVPIQSLSHVLYGARIHSRRMVLQLPSTHLHVCATEVLEQRPDAVLDRPAAAQFPHLCTRVRSPAHRLRRARPCSTIGAK